MLNPSNATEEKRRGKGNLREGGRKLSKTKTKRKMMLLRRSRFPSPRSRSGIPIGASHRLLPSTSTSSSSSSYSCNSSTQSSPSLTMSLALLLPAPPASSPSSSSSSSSCFSLLQPSLSSPSPSISKRSRLNFNLNVINLASQYNGRRRCFSTTAATTLDRDSIIIVKKEIQEALERGSHPILGLESTILTHGLTFPDNLNLYKRILDMLWEEYGVLGAVTAVIGGRMHVGLTEGELERVCRTATHSGEEGGEVSKERSVKSTTRELCIQMNSFNRSSKEGIKVGGTTVASTMWALERVGIKVFSTGGIGGVHRKTSPESPLDVSADLDQLATTGVVVVCAGVKSILDIGGTLEFLETRGVPVITFSPEGGESVDFPAFYTRNSGFKGMYTTSSLEELTSIAHAHLNELPSRGEGRGSGMVVAVPIPKEDCMDLNKPQDSLSIREIIDDALVQAERNNVKGKEVTPFLLSAIASKSGGRSVKANLALFENNCREGARLARGLHDLSKSPFHKSPSNEGGKGRVVIMGATVLDISMKMSPPSSPLTSGKFRGVSVPGRVEVTSGGVGRNILHSYTLYNSHPTRKEVTSPPLFISCVSPNEEGIGGGHLKRELKSLGVDLSYCLPPEKMGRRDRGGGGEAVYGGVYDPRGELLGAVASMQVHEDPATIKFLLSSMEEVFNERDDLASLVVVDANFPLKVLDRLVELCEKRGKVILFEPTSPSKCLKLFNLLKSNDTLSKKERIQMICDRVGFITPDEHELEVLEEGARKEGWMDIVGDPECMLGTWVLPHDQEGGGGGGDVPSKVWYRVEKLLNLFPKIIVKLGEKGVLVGTRFPLSVGRFKYGKSLTHIPPSHLPKMVNVSGAGDSLVGVFVADLLARGASDPRELSDHEVVSAARLGMEAAQLTCESPGISPEISRILPFPVSFSNKIIKG